MSDHNEEAVDLFANDELKDDLAEVEALASAITFEELQANDVGISKEDFIRGVILDLRVVAWEGKLQFRVPRLGGRGDCNKRGTAAYMGKPVSSHDRGVPFKLDLTHRFIAVLSLDLKGDGNWTVVYRGVGRQKGLSGVWFGTTG